MSAQSRKWANIKVDPEVRNRVRRLKRGQESYSDLLQKMAKQYDPDAAREENN